MISVRKVFGKLKERVSPKLFFTHCPPHRLVLTSKAGPNDIEKTFRHFFFKDNSVRRDKFKVLKELVEPNSPFVSTVQYHKVKWLSLADCIGRLVKLLVRYLSTGHCK